MTLPIYELADAIVRELGSSNRLIIQAPTGSGKSTQVPQILLDRNMLGTGQVVILQPRRLAARMLARRVAHERSCALGKEVGFQVRFENQCGAQTRIRFVTEGILLRQMLANEDLPGVSAIIFDEFHERHLYGDITLARALLLQKQRGPDLKIVVMSATMDTAMLTPYLHPCAVLQSEGRMFPVKVEYLGRSIDPRHTPIWEAAADAVEGLLASEKGPGDTLVFMPGAYEISRTIDALSSRDIPDDCRVLPLHGELSPGAQDSAVGTSDWRKIVVATNIAETSITIPGVRYVVDGGIARVARYDARRGINTLLIEKISQAAADQRAGRAGRTAPGVCVRLWTAAEHRERPLQETPEVKRLDLAEVVLALKASGFDDLGEFHWLEAPDPVALQRAETLLEDLGALDHKRRINELGRRMLSFPVHPRYSRMLIAAAQYGCVRQASLIAALTQDRQIFTRGAEGRSRSDREDILGESPNSDFFILMRAWNYAERCRYDGEGCRRLGINAQAARQVRPLFEFFLNIAKEEGLPINDRPVADELVQKCILTGFVDHLALRRDGGTLRCQLSHGRSGELARESCVRDSRLLVAAELREIQSGKGEIKTLLGLATAVEEAWLKELYPEDFSEESRPTYDHQQKRVVAERRRLFRDLVLESKIGNDPAPEAAAQILAAEIEAGRITLERWDDAVEQWITRLNCLAAWLPHLELPVLDAEKRRLVQERVCAGAVSAKDLKDRKVWPVLQDLLTYKQREILEREVPAQIQLPGGRKAKLTYQVGGSPLLSATIQDLYDLKDAPRVAMGKIAVRVEILGPNRRPVQVTEDLRSFWQTTYPDLKRQLQRKYPKHEWR